MRKQWCCVNVLVKETGRFFVFFFMNVMPVEPAHISGTDSLASSCTAPPWSQKEVVTYQSLRDGVKTW